MMRLLQQAERNLIATNGHMVKLLYEVLMLLRQLLNSKKTKAPTWLFSK